MTRQIPEPVWSVELHRFTNRNAGRAMTLEHNAPALFAPRWTAQPLRGITYDAAGDRVLITMGEQKDVTHQLTHFVEHASAIIVLSDWRGRDEALAIKQNDTQTLLRFVDL